MKQQRYCSSNILSFINILSYCTYIHTCTVYTLYIPCWRRYTPPHLACGFAPKTWGGGIYPISPGYKPLQTKIRVNTTSISAMIHKKHIYRFVLHTAVHSSTEKTTVFSGRLRLYYRHRHKNANFSKQIVVLPAKTVVAAILYASVGNEQFTRARPRNFYTQNSRRINSHRKFYYILCNSRKKIGCRLRRAVMVTAPTVPNFVSRIPPSDPRNQCGTLSCANSQRLSAIVVTPSTSRWRHFECFRSENRPGRQSQNRDSKQLQSRDSFGSGRTVTAAALEELNSQTITREFDGKLLRVRVVDSHSLFPVSLFNEIQSSDTRARSPLFVLECFWINEANLPAKIDPIPAVCQWENNSAEFPRFLLDGLRL